MKQLAIISKMTGKINNLREKLTICEQNCEKPVPAILNPVEKCILPIPTAMKDLMLLGMCILSLGILIGELFQYLRARAHRKKSE